GSVVFAGLLQAISCCDVSFAYVAERPVLYAISLTIPRHTTVAFVGASGAGKSTLADLLAGTLKPTTGTIVVHAISPTEIDLATYRHRIGYVPQDAIVFDDTVANNISLWRDGITAEQIADAARRAYCVDFIEAMPERYEAPIGDRGVMLSGGQRQRL